MLGKVGLVLTVTALAFSAVAVISDPVSAQQPVTQNEVSVRDNLIAQQESLLNTYRCQFNIDTLIVPDGCTNGEPARGPTDPATLDGIPTQADLSVRDNLIAQQESLLNTYRCRFNIDTEIVPGGCTDGRPAPTEPSDQAPSGQYTAVAAGQRHVCALRTDQTIACWGDNGYQQANAPAGQFTAVSSGHEHVCALRTDQTIACWGDNAHGQADAPNGQYTAVSAGASLTCGLRTNGTITCWGSDSQGESMVPAGKYTAVSTGTSFVCALRTDATIACWGDDSRPQADAPEGQYTAIAAGDLPACALRTDARVICWGHLRHFVPNGPYSAIAAGGRHSCGLRTDLNITCWGVNANGQTHAPEGQFTAITAGGEQSCGIRTDQTIACWGEDPSEPTNAPDGQFTAITAGYWHTCGLRIDQTITCWGKSDQRQADPPDGQFTAITAGAWHSCGLRIDQTITCWGEVDGGSTGPPEGQFAAIAAGSHHTCALSTDATIACWGDNSAKLTSAPEGQFTAITARNLHTCALRTDATIACWGISERGQADPPDGQFTAITAGNWHTCGLRDNTTTTCWGSNDNGQSDVPFVQFSAIAAGVRHTCGLRIDAAIACWGYLDRLADPPDGQFTAIAAGVWHSCGIRTDQTIACWGLRSFIPTFAGVQRLARGHLANPDMCRPQGLSSGTTVGFPLPSLTPNASGTVKVAVLFMDFPDAAATHSTHVEAELGLPFAEKYLESVSYEQLDIKFIPLHKWLRVEDSFTNHISDSDSSSSKLMGVSATAVRLADPEFDFTGIDVVMVITPSSYFSGGNALGIVDTQEGKVLATSRINSTYIAGGPHDLAPWGRTAAHELAHNLGLSDLYPYNAQELPNVPAGKVRGAVSFGLMGLGASFLTNPRDPRFAYDWNHPSGRTTTEYSYGSNAREMLAWSRWQLGWLKDSQIRCVTEPEAVIDLRPIAVDPGDGIAMAAIPLSDTELIVIESRRKTGYDLGTPYRSPSGLTFTIPALPVEGVIVYTVDAALSSGDLPLKLAGDSGNRQVADLPILTLGQSITIRGYTVTVHSATPDIHTVAITQAGSA